MEIERRRHPRFKIRGNAFALFQPEPVKLVPIVDIGLGGLGIGVNGIHTGDEWLNSASCLEILIDDCSFYMDNLGYELNSQIQKRSSKRCRPFPKNLRSEICRSDVHSAIPAEIFYSKPYDRRNDTEIYPKNKSALPSIFRQKELWACLPKHQSTTSFFMIENNSGFQIRLQPCSVRGQVCS